MQINIPIIIDKIKLILTATITVLIVGNIFLGAQYFLKAQKIETLQGEVKSQQTNPKIINFLILFTEKVLKSNKEVSFEDRLLLENSVSDLNEPKILGKWQQFIESKNESEIQQRVIDLIETSLKKISY